MPSRYTLNAPTNSYAVNAVFLKLPYDPIADITPIAVLGTSGYLLVVPPSLGVTSMKQFLEYAQAHPGMLNYGSTGVGAISHLAVELFKQMAKVELTHIPYKGTSQVL
ncbi:MAG: tripartite tricarboxylate transporter substrate-binding protein, partial [Opitutae bacterium]